MGFLEKIIANIKKEKKSSFRESVKKEKKEKYLFTEPAKKEDQVQGFELFRKKGGVRSSSFSRFFDQKIEATRDFAERQESYMKWIGIFLIGASLYIILYSPYFLLSPSKVMIEALDDTIDVSIAYRSIEDIYGKNVLLLDKTTLANTIQSAEKNISNIRIDHLYPNSLKILLSGQPISFELSIKSRPWEKWGMTENGVLVPEEKIITSASGILELTLIDASMTEDSLLDYRDILSTEKVTTIRKMLSTFQATWPMLPVANSVYLKRENELHILLVKSTRIIFTLQDFTKKADESIDYKYLSLEYTGLKTFVDGHSEDVKDGVYTYIDARIPERVFSCRDRVQCGANLLQIYPDIK
jgi:hypothetical protein